MTVPTLSSTTSIGTVTLRALNERDIAGVLEQCVDPLSIEWTQVPVPFGLADAREFVEVIAPNAWADGSQWIFAVEHDTGDGPRYAGNIALRDEGHGLAEIAYGSHPGARGTGAIEAGLQLLLEWGFGTQGLQTVIWRANKGNWASRKVAWRLGFRIDGVLRHSHVFRGELVDGWVGTLVADEPREPRHRWLDVPELRGGGVCLRAVTDDDTSRIVEACGDPRTQQWLGLMPSPYTADDAWAWRQACTEKRATGTGTTWAITADSPDTPAPLLGAISLFDLNDDDVEIGYWAHPEARGRGVMTAAVRAVTTWAFEELGVGRVRIVCAVDNAASRHVAEAAGFTETGGERRATRVRDGRADVVLYDVLDSEWATGSQA